MAANMLWLVDKFRDALLREMGDEVELIFQYGSYLTGSTHQYSDLDISYVPAHESTWHAITVMVDDTMVDLYPIHWSRLEKMANFDDISCSLLLENRIVYQRTELAAEYFRNLPARLQALRKADARPAMLRKAQDIFQKTGYQYYLLQQQAALGNQLACLHHGRHILQTILHCLIVCNQAPIDSRKLDQLLALPKLPLNFAATMTRVTKATEPDAILSAYETLMHSTRELLLKEQRDVPRKEMTFAEVFYNAYPELKNDLQHLMLACERQEPFNINLTALYHELMIHMAQVCTGVEYSSFNSLAEYEQDLAGLGFPDLLPYVTAWDFAGLYEQCRIFDQRLQQYLTEHEVALNSFATVDDLKFYLDDIIFKIADGR